MELLEGQDSYGSWVRQSCPAVATLFARPWLPGIPCPHGATALRSSPRA